jgi:hypothetical protein
MGAAPVEESTPWSIVQSQAADFIEREAAGGASALGDEILIAAAEYGE